MNYKIRLLEKEQMKEAVPDFKVGDTIKVHLKIKESGKERIQAFEGFVIARKCDGLRENFTVRRISHSVGVERTFLLHSPLIEKIQLVRQGLVRRAKLYYLRDKVGKEARIKMKKR